MAKFGKELIVRTLSGVALFVAVVLAVGLSEYSFAALALTICLGSMWEYFRIARQTDVQPQKWYSLTVGGAAVVLSFLTAAGIIGPKWLLAIIPLAFTIFFIELFRGKPAPIANTAVSLGGIVYAALPMSLLCFMAYAGGEYSPFLMLAYIFTVWVNDIFAYLTGVAIGRHRMFERISPKKSWEGFFGGLVLAVAFAVLCGWWSGGNMLVWGGFGLVVVVSGVLGDLVESMFKRAAGVKDSGRILPGHGGFMDRFDALLLSAPFVFVYFTIFNPF